MKARLPLKVGRQRGVDGLPTAIKGFKTHGVVLFDVLPALHHLRRLAINADRMNDRTLLVHRAGSPQSRIKSQHFPNSAQHLRLKF